MNVDIFAILSLVIIWGFGILGGWILSDMSTRHHTEGTLRIDSSDSEGIYLFLELETSIDKLRHEDTVVFRVKDESYLPQK